jgi:hypothetical protein
MPSSFSQPTPVGDEPPQPLSTGRVMGWLVVSFLAFWPRVTLIGFWIFSDLLGDAYDGWVVPAVGFLLLPTTTITYAMMWGVSSDTVSGAEWIVVAIGLGLDLLTWAAVRSLRAQ